MAKVAVRKDELEHVMKIAKRAAGRTNSVVVIAEDRLDIEDGSPAEKAIRNAQPAHFN